MSLADALYEIGKQHEFSMNMASAMEEHDKLNKLFSMAKEDEEFEKKSVLVALDLKPDDSKYDDALTALSTNFRGNVDELMKFREVVPQIIEYANNMRFYVFGLQYLINFLSEDPTNSNKRWSDEEDNDLVEAVCKGMNIWDVARCLKRTPGAVSTRLSYLVGVNRISQDIAGKFVGQIDGEQRSANIVGTIFRREKT